MPHINIKMYPGKPEAAKQSLADKIMVLAQEELGCPMEALSVSIQEVAPESWNETVADVLPGDAVVAGEMWRVK